MIPISLIWNEEMIFLGWFTVKVRTYFLIISLIHEQEKGWTTHTHTLTRDYGSTFVVFVSSCYAFLWSITSINRWIERWSLIVVIDSLQISSEGSKDEVLILEQVKLNKDCETWK